MLCISLDSWRGRWCSLAADIWRIVYVFVFVITHLIFLVDWLRLHVTAISSTIQLTIAGAYNNPYNVDHVNG